MAIPPGVDREVEDIPLGRSHVETIVARSKQARFTGSRGVGELRYFFAAEEAQIGRSALFLASSDPGKSVSQSPRLPVQNSLLWEAMTRSSQPEIGLAQAKGR